MALARNLLKLSSRIGRQSCRSYTHGEFKTPVEVVQEMKSGLSDMPVPNKQWKEFHTQRTNRWNLQLAVAGAFFGFTMFMMFYTNSYLKFGPPDLKKVKLDPKAINPLM